MNNYELRTNCRWLSYQLKTNKRFRLWTRNKCQQIRAISKNNREICFCNIIIKYIYGLDWQDIQAEKQKI